MLLVVGAGSHRHRAFQALVRTGDMLGIVGLPGSHPYGQLCDAAIYDNPRDPSRLPAICEAAGELDSHYGIRGVVTLDELSVVMAAEVAAHLGLPGISPDAARAARNKYEMRRRFAQAGLPNPHFAPITNLEELVAFSRQVGFPLVLKPADCGGSAGVIKVTSADQLAPAIDHARGSTKIGLLIAEAFMAGPEVSVEVIAFGGRVEVVAVTEKRTTNGPYFVELGHVVPADLPREMLSEIEETARMAVSALGITLGGAHVEVKLTPQGPVLVEVGARLAGDLIPDLVQLATGADLYGAITECAMGNEPWQRLKRTRDVWAGIRFLDAPPGIVQALPEPSELVGRVDGLVDFELGPRVGDRIEAISANWRRPGHILMTAPSREQLLNRLDELEKTCAITVAEERGSAV